MAAITLEKVSGTIEALGQCKVDQTGHLYSYLRVLTTDGRVQMIDNVGVLNTVGSYVNTGVQGDLYLVKYGKWHGLYGIRTGDDIAGMRSLLRTIVWRTIIMCILAGLVGLLFMGLGVLLWIYAVYVGVAHNVPGEREMRDALGIA